MLRFEDTEVWGFDKAIAGMRNPLNSWNKNDSMVIDGAFSLGENDKKLAQRLICAGTEHSKFMRMIHVQSTLFAPRFFWSEFDTYKFVEKNSTSTMHKLLNNKYPITIDLFNYTDEDKDIMILVVNRLEELRKEFMFVMQDENIVEKPKILNQLLYRAKSLLPESFIQMRTIDTNYAEIRNMYFQRKNHRLPDWNTCFVKWVESLPYAKELITFTKKENKNE